MWRKFSAAQASSASSSSKKVPHSTGTTSSAGGFGFGEPTDVAAVPARRRLPDDSVHDMIGIEKRRRRRRKSRPKRNGWVQWYFCSYCPSAVDIATCSYGPQFSDTARSGISRKIRYQSLLRRRSNRKRWPSWNCLTLPWTGICKWLNASRAGEWRNGGGGGRKRSARIKGGRYKPPLIIIMLFESNI